MMSLSRCCHDNTRLMFDSLSPYQQHPLLLGSYLYRQNKRHAPTSFYKHRPRPRHTLIHGRPLTWPRDRFVPYSASILAHFRSGRINFQSLPVRFRWCVAPSGRTPRWRHSVAWPSIVTCRHCGAAPAFTVDCRLYARVKFLQTTCILINSP